MFDISTTDHYRLALYFGDIPSGPCPFRFDISWLPMESFQGVINNGWNQNPLQGQQGLGFMMKPRGLKLELKNWNTTNSNVASQLRRK